MRLSMRCKAFVLFALILASAPAQVDSALADPALVAAAEIDHLIAFIGSSTCIFNRNGDDYDGAAAAEHIAEKYAYYRDDITSAADFIDLAASRSALTGRPYQVRCAGSDAMPARDWLLLELETYRQTPHSPVQAP
jgi:hypothetical protein